MIVPCFLEDEMKNQLCVLFLVIVVSCWAQKNDPSLLFKAEFDNYSVRADYAAGQPDSVDFKGDLSLRMFPGPAGKGNAVKLLSSEKISYMAAKNINPKQGTVSFWISPQKWDYNKKQMHTFFETYFGPYVVTIFETDNYKRMTFVFAQQSPKYFEAGQVILPLPQKEWGKGRWHKIDATWNDKTMALYVDGVLGKTEYSYWRNPRNFDKPIDWPDLRLGQTMTLGWGTRHEDCKFEETAFDDLMIYDRALSPAEIKLNYEKSVPQSKKDKNPPEISVPQGKTVSVDGILNPAEWSDAACIVIRNPEKGSNIKNLSAKVYLKQNGNDLMVGLEAVGGQKADVTGDDIVDIWQDDAFEFHVMTKDKRRYQFILNSRGAMFDVKSVRNDGVYDQNKLDTKWNSGAKRAARRVDGKWTLELVIPKKNIGADQDSVLANFCVTSYQNGAEYVTWGTDCANYYDETRFGTLRFKDSGKPVRLEKCQFTDGEFELKLTPEINTKLITADGMILPRPPGDTWKIALAEGVYDFSAKGQNFFYNTRIVVNKPFEMDYTCHASKHRLDVNVDLSCASNELRKLIDNKGVSVKIAVVGADQSVMASSSFPVSKMKDVYALQLPVSPKRGVYQVHATILEQGKETLHEKKRFRVPDMTPYLHPVAKDHSVPNPWLPVKQLDTQRFQVWNRIYTFQNGPFPVQIESEGKQMLRQGPNLYLAGVPVQWSNVKVAEKHDDEIRLTGTGSAKGLKFTWDSTVCFDGLVKIRISMAPENGSARISDLKLRWSVPAEFARSMLDPLYVRGWKNKDHQVYKFPYAHGGDFMIWTVGVKHGFIWWSESCANWKNPDGHKQFSLSRNGDTVTVNADFITGNAELKKEAEYIMAFQATPHRPEVRNRRDYNPGHIWGLLKYETHKVQYLLPTPVPLPQSTEPWNGLIPYDPVKFQKHIDDLETKGTHFMTYSQPLMTDILEESYDYFFPEWKQIPGYTCGGGVSFRTGEHFIPESCCGHTGAEDLFVWRAEKHLEQFPKVVGIYYDCSTGRFCSNHLHGCGGTDAFGQSYASSGLIRLRDYYIRLKRVFTKNGRDKILYIHAHERFCPFSQGMGDYYCTGEQYFTSSAPNVDYFYCEDVPLGEYQSLYYTPIKGTGMVMEFAMIYLNMAKLTTKNCRLPEYTLKVLTPCIVHDINVAAQYLNEQVMGHWWELKHDIKLADAVFHGYWFSDAVKSGTDKMYVSWYEWKKPSPYSRMLVVANFGRVDKLATLKIDWKELGVDPNLVIFEDVWDAKPLNNLNNLQVKSNDFRLIGMKKK